MSAIINFLEINNTVKSLKTDILAGCMQTEKSWKIISKSPKVWKVRECEKMMCMVKESQKTFFFAQIFDLMARNYCYLEI